MTEKFYSSIINKIDEYFILTNYTIYYDKKQIKKGHKIMLKNTKTRELIKALLDSSNSPLSAYDIFDALKSQGVTLSSIYRTLDTFYKNSIISKEITTDGVSLYSIPKEEHSHFLECKNCHKVIELNYCPYHKVNAQIKAKHHFVVDEHNVVIYGLCPDCYTNNSIK